MSLILFKNAKLLDPTKADLQDGVAVLVEGSRIREVSPRPIRTSGATVVDVGGRTLMPGLIDCHVHVFLPEVNIRALEAVPLTLLTARAAAAHARHAGPRLHDGARHGRRGLGHPGGGRARVSPRAAPVHRGARDRPDERPQRPAPADRPRAAAARR